MPSTICTGTATGARSVLGLLVDVGNGVLMGQHALAYSLLAFAASARKQLEPEIPEYENDADTKYPREQFHEAAVVARWIVDDRRWAGWLRVQERIQQLSGLRETYDERAGEVAIAKSGGHQIVSNTGVVVPAESGDPLRSVEKADLAVLQLDHEHDDVVSGAAIERAP